MMQPEGLQDDNCLAALQAAFLYYILPRAMPWLLHFSLSGWLSAFRAEQCRLLKGEQILLSFVLLNAYALPRH